MSSVERHQPGRRSACVSRQNRMFMSASQASPSNRPPGAEVMLPKGRMGSYISNSGRDESGFDGWKRRNWLHERGPALHRGSQKPTVPCRAELASRSNLAGNVSGAGLSTPLPNATKWPGPEQNRDEPSDLLSNYALRFAIERNLVVYPAQIPRLIRGPAADSQERMAHLYFVCGWSIKLLCERYQLSKSKVQKLLNDWRVRAVSSGYVQQIDDRDTPSLL